MTRHFTYLVVATVGLTVGGGCAAETQGARRGELWQPPAVPQHVADRCAESRTSLCCWPAPAVDQAIQALHHDLARCGEAYPTDMRLDVTIVADDGRPSCVEVQHGRHRPPSPLAACVRAVVAAGYDHGNTAGQRCDAHFPLVFSASAGQKVSPPSSR